MIKFRLHVSFVIVLCCLNSVAGQSNDDAAARIAAEGQQAMAQGRMGDAKASREKLALLEPSVAEVLASLSAICFKLR